MSYFAKQRLLYYKRFKIDIWGMFKNSLQWRKDRSNYFCNNLKGRNFFFKRLNWIKTKDYKNQQRNEKINKVKKIFKKKIDWRKYISKNRLNIIRIYSILYTNLLFKIFKTGILRKLTRLFMFFLEKKSFKDKIYYRAPFIYEMRDRWVNKKKYYAQSQFASLRITRLFYIIYTYRQLKNLCKKAKRKDGLFEQNYLLLMECKLPSFIYRSSFISNMFDSFKFVKRGNVWINKTFIIYIHYTVKPFDIVGFRILSKSFIYWNFFKRLRRKAFIFLLPSFIYFSIVFLILLFLRIPSKKDIINPISLDMYRLANYAV